MKQEVAVAGLQHAGAVQEAAMQACSHRPHTTGVVLQIVLVSCNSKMESRESQKGMPFFH